MHTNHSLLYPGQCHRGSGVYPVLLSAKKRKLRLQWPQTEKKTSLLRSWDLESQDRNVMWSFDVLWFLRCFFSQRGWKQWLESLPVRLNQSGRSPLPSLINKTFPPAELLLLPGCSFVVVDDVHTILTNLWRQLFVKISSSWKTQSSPAGTNNHATVPEMTCFPSLMLDMNINWSSWRLSTWFYASCCWHVIGGLDNCMNEQFVVGAFALMNRIIRLACLRRLHVMWPLNSVIIRTGCNFHK